MKSAVVLLAVTLALVATPAVAQKVYVDHDDAVDFSTVTTFVFVETGDDLKESDPLAHDRVVAAIRTQFVAVGMREVEEGPQLSVTYHASEEKETRINTTHTGLNWGSSWVRGSSGISKTDSNVITYTTGTLVVDIVEVEGETLIWRGTAPGVLTGNPQKKEKRVNRAIDKLVKEWSRLQGSG
jgi:hypothetical protein